MWFVKGWLKEAVKGLLFLDLRSQRLDGDLRGKRQRETE